MSDPRYFEIVEKAIEIENIFKVFHSSPLLRGSQCSGQIYYECPDPRCTKNREIVSSLFAEAKQEPIDRSGLCIK